LIDVAAVESRNSALLPHALSEPLEHAELLAWAFVPEISLAVSSRAPLKAELQMVEAGVDQFCEASFIEWHAGRDEIYVKPAVRAARTIRGCRCGRALAAG